MFEQRRNRAGRASPCLSPAPSSREAPGLTRGLPGTVPKADVLASVPPSSGGPGSRPISGSGPELTGMTGGIAEGLVR